MGNAGAKRSNPIFEQMKARFSAEEVLVLKQTFEDLQSRNASGDNGVDKRTFLRVFNLPGMLGERLFAVFDRKSRDYLDFEDFICGLAAVVRGSLDEKIQFLFTMYDLKGNGFVSKQELTTMMNSAVFAAYSLFDNAFPHHHFNSEDDPNIRRELQEQVDEMVQAAFAHADKIDERDGKSPALSQEAFKKFIIENPESLEVIESVFNKTNVSEDRDDLQNEVDENEGIPSNAIKQDGILKEDNAQISSSRRSRFSTTPMRIPKSKSRESLTSNRSPLGTPKGRTARSFSTMQSRSRKARRSFSADVRKKFLDDVFTVSTPSRNSPVNSIGRTARSKSRIGRKAFENRGIHFECKQCNLKISIFFCYKCGMALHEAGECSRCQQEVFVGGTVNNCFVCGFDLRLNEMPVEPPKYRGSFISKRVSNINWSVFPNAVGGSSASSGAARINNASTQTKEGWMFKVGTRFGILKKKWFVLRDSFLYLFNGEFDRKPAAVIFLEGCFVEPLDDAKQSKCPFGIEIVVSDDKSKSKIFWCYTEEDRNEWLDLIKNAAQVYEFDDYYEMGCELGTGKFSSVRECTNRASGGKYAVKIIEKSQMNDKDKESLRTEIAILQLVNHPNVISLKNVFESRNRIYIVMGLVRGGDLFDRLASKRRFDEFTTRSIILKLLSTVQYLHDYGIVHRDLKPENIMVVNTERDDNIKIADFGLSKFAAPEEVMKLPCGTLAYVAPEVLQMTGYGKEVDVWSIGVIMFVLLRGKLPFDGKKRSHIIQKTIAGKINLEDDIVWDKVTPEGKDLISKLLITDPRKRITISEAINHKWFQISLSEPAMRKSKAKPRRSFIVVSPRNIDTIPKKEDPNSDLSSSTKLEDSRNTKNSQDDSCLESPNSEITN